MASERLYYQDCYLREFTAQVVEVADGGRRVYLDRTAFYPTSGGQPFDTGTLNEATVVEIIDEGDDSDDRIAHVLDRPVSLGPVRAKIDWARRYDHMQQHTGQHLLSAVLAELFKFPTLSFHMGIDLSSIEIGAPALSASQIEKAEQRAAELVAQALPVVISFDDASANLGLRKASERTGTLRIIAIDGVDRSACGGTHVRTTAEIGAVFIRKLEKIRGNVRLEFVCGARARRHAKTDFSTLQEISRLLSVPAQETPALLAAQMERLKTLEKSAQRLTIELAQLRGKELWAATPPDPSNLRKVTEHGPIDDAMRVRAQAFVSLGQAVFIGVSEDPPAILLAASADSGLNAGERVKSAVTAAGGRGGGNAALAQGSLPAGADVASVLHFLTA